MEEATTIETTCNKCPQREKKPELSYGQKAQLGTPADCLNFARQFLLAAVSPSSPCAHSPYQATLSHLLGAGNSQFDGTFAARCFCLLATYMCSCTLAKYLIHTFKTQSMAIG